MGDTGDEPDLDEETEVGEPHHKRMRPRNLEQVPNIFEDDRDSSSAENSDADDNEISLEENDHLEDIVMDTDKNVSPNNTFDNFAPIHDVNDNVDNSLDDNNNKSSDSKSAVLP